MRYLGGKARLRDSICNVLNAIDVRIYLEPFCGACWVGEKVNKSIRIMSDVNCCVIAMWQALQNGWIPPNSAPSEIEYKNIRDNPTYSKELKGFIGIAQSYGGKFWGGYARGKMANGLDRDYTTNAYNQCIKRIKNMLDVNFRYSTYSKMLIKSMKLNETILMYLDPPYETTTEYTYLPKFNTELFWENVRRVSKKHYVVTSGYNSPQDFTVIREWQPTTGMNIGNNEKLFCYGKILEDYDLC